MVELYRSLRTKKKWRMSKNPENGKVSMYIGKDGIWDHYFYLPGHKSTGMSWYSLIRNCGYAYSGQFCNFTEEGAKGDSPARCLGWHQLLVEMIA